MHCQATSLTSLKNCQQSRWLASAERLGKPARAPTAVHLQAATTEASRSAASGCMSWQMAYCMAPMKASPAPVVSCTAPCIQERLWDMLKNECIAVRLFVGKLSYEIVTAFYRHSLLRTCCTCRAVLAWPAHTNRQADQSRLYASACRAVLQADRPEASNLLQQVTAQAHLWQGGSRCSKDLQG